MPTPLHCAIILIVLILANFRISVFLADDTGPYDIFTKIRVFLKRKAKTEPAVRKSKVHEGIECKRCNSVWSGMALAGWCLIHELVPRSFAVGVDALLLSFALSGASILLVRAFPPR